jgi:hypothetical protein
MNRIIMESAKEFMADWTIQYLKNKDLLLRAVISIDAKEDGIYVKYKNKEQIYLLFTIVKDVADIVQRLKLRQNIAVICLNSAENLQAIIKNWKLFIDYPQFFVIFINPFSNLDSKWHISPYTHHKICDNSALVIGLKSMFNTVEPISEEQFQCRVNNTRK